MQAFETVGTIDTKGHLKLTEPLQFRNKIVKVIILIADVEETEKDSSDWWDELSPEQQMELETALAECDNPSKLTAHEEVVKMSKQWLQE